MDRAYSLGHNPTLQHEKNFHGAPFDDESLDLLCRLLNRAADHAANAAAQEGTPNAGATRTTASSPPAPGAGGRVTLAVDRLKLDTDPKHTVTSKLGRGLALFVAQRPTPYGQLAGDIAARRINGPATQQARAGLPPHAAKTAARAALGMSPWTPDQLAALAARDPQGAIAREIFRASPLLTSRCLYCPASGVDPPPDTYHHGRYHCTQHARQTARTCMAALKAERLARSGGAHHAYPHHSACDFETDPWSPLAEACSLKHSPLPLTHHVGIATATQPTGPAQLPSPTPPPRLGTAPPHTANTPRPHPTPHPPPTGAGRHPGRAIPPPSRPHDRQ